MAPISEFVLSEDKAKYSDFVKHYLGRFAVLPSGPLYHYTTGETFIRIIESGEFWSTQLSCLNDTREFIFAIDELLKRTRLKISENSDPVVNHLLRAVEKGLQDPGTERVGLFVSCFTDRPDDLSQWRAYGGGEGGYALAFDALTLAREGLRQGAFLIRCEYKPDNQAVILDDILKWTIEFFKDGITNKRAPTIEEWIADFLPVWSDQVIAFAAFLKHKSFEPESEWRFVYFLQDEALSRMKFLQKNSMMTRHAPLHLLSGPDGRPRLPLCGVTVGPCRHKEVSKISVGDLLKRSGYDPDSEVPVTLTDIPYRSV